MNIYDFDGTIYPRDSSVEFFRYCIKQKPRLCLYGLEQVTGFMLYGLGGVGKTRLKEYFFSFLRGVPDTAAAVRSFWATRLGDMAPWLAEVRQPGDLVISASPEFLLAPACEALGLTLIASQVDPKTGKFTGENCHGEEKLRLFQARYPGVTPERFYSDTLSDAPLAALARESYLVRGGRPEPWPV